MSDNQTESQHDQPAETPSAKPLPAPARRSSWLPIALLLGGLFIMFFLFVASALVAASPSGFEFGGPKIGVVEVVGPIMESKTAVSDLKKFREDETIVGIVVRVDSPGGAVGPSQELFQAVQLAEKKKPLAVSMGSTAASGGYYTAIGSKKIFANGGTITGSIGVITQLFDVSQLVDLAKVRVNTIKTGPYKDVGSPFREFTESDRAELSDLIHDVYDQFVEDVAKARNMEPNKVREYANGRVFTGRQAKKYGLVDEVGTLEDAIAWVAGEASVEGEPEVVYPVRDTNPLSDLLSGGVQTIVKETKAQATPLIEYRYVGPQ